MPEIIFPKPVTEKPIPKGFPPHLNNPQADWLIAGPNVEFLEKIHKAFSPGVQAHYIRYNAQANARNYKRIILFVVKVPQAYEAEFQSWVYYLQSRLEMNSKGDVTGEMVVV